MKSSELSNRGLNRSDSEDVPFLTAFAAFACIASPILAVLQVPWCAVIICDWVSHASDDDPSPGPSLFASLMLLMAPAILGFILGVFGRMRRDIPPTYRWSAVAGTSLCAAFFLLPVAVYMCGGWKIW
jgi:hypothetical protein